jgi:hypothetical protein
MDPLNDLRAEIRDVGPVARVRALMEAQEHREDQQAEARRYEHAAKVEADLMRMVNQERWEVYTQGHTNRELRRQEAVREEIRTAEIEQHLAALRRLDPVRFSDGLHRSQGRGLAQGQDGPPPQQLRRTREFMLDQVRRFNERRDGR